MKKYWFTWFGLVLALINLPFVLTGSVRSAISMGFILGLMVADFIERRGEKA